MTNPIIVDVKPRGIESAYKEAPFDQAKEALEKAGYHIISLQENARLRIQEGRDARCTKEGNRVMEATLYVPRKGVFLTKKSPIMANAEQATECHRGEKEFYLTAEEVEESLQDSVELTERNIPVDRFGEDETTKYAFGEDAEEYGKFLKEARINAMPVVLGSVSNKPFARQIWFSWVGADNSSNLIGSDVRLNNNLRVRGVRNSAQTLEVYTLGDISSTLEDLKLTGLERQILDGLKKRRD